MRFCGMEETTQTNKQTNNAKQQQERKQKDNERVVTAVISESYTQHKT